MLANASSTSSTQLAALIEPPRKQRHYRSCWSPNNAAAQEKHLVVSGAVSARHMAAAKSMHWHVDFLTEAKMVLGAWTFPGGSECDLVTRLSHLPIAVEGFESRDCRKCTSHLFR